MSIPDQFLALSSLQYKDAVRHTRDREFHQVVTDVGLVRRQPLPPRRAQFTHPHEQHPWHRISARLRRNNYMGQPACPPN